MGPGTVQAIEKALAAMASSPDPYGRSSTGSADGTLPTSALLASAADANPAGERFAARHAELAAAAGVPFARVAPTIGIDWNDVLKGSGA